MTTQYRSSCNRADSMTLKNCCFSPWDKGFALNTWLFNTWSLSYGLGKSCFKQFAYWTLFMTFRIFHSWSSLSSSMSMAPSLGSLMSENKHVYFQLFNIPEAQVLPYFPLSFPVCVPDSQGHGCWIVCTPSLFFMQYPFSHGVE